MKKAVIILSIITGILIGCLIAVLYSNQHEVAKWEALLDAQQTLFERELEDAMISPEWYEADGYEDIVTWWNNLIYQKEKFSSIASQATEELGEYLSEEQMNILAEISAKIKSSHSIKEMTRLVLEANEIKASAVQLKQQAEQAEEPVVQEQEEIVPIEVENYEEPSYEEPVYEEAIISGNAEPSYDSGYSGNFMRDGVIYMYGYRYTWYSSRAAYHYMTGQWWTGSDGIYRDSDGYIIVASDDDGYGSVVPTPFGEGKVYDSGAGSGTRDIYVNW